MTPGPRELEAHQPAGDPQERLVRGTIAHVLDITVSESTSASPDQVLAAANDLSEDRVKVWPNSKPQQFEVHAQGAGFAEVTEGFRPPFGNVWERSRYEWEPRAIRQTVIDSNVLAPGSTWELKVSPKRRGQPRRDATEAGVPTQRKGSNCLRDQPPRGQTHVGLVPAQSPGRGGEALVLMRDQPSPVVGSGALDPTTSIQPANERAESFRAIRCNPPAQRYARPRGSPDQNSERSPRSW